MKTEHLKPIYIADFEFQNIKKIEIYMFTTEFNEEAAKIFISVDKPVNCQKLYPFNQ